MSATPGAAEFGAFTLGGDDDTDLGPSTMSVQVAETGRLDIGVESTGSMTIGVS